MNDDALFAVLPLASLMMLAGLALGLIYFRALRLTVDGLTRQREWSLPLVLTLARLSGAVILLSFAAYLGPAPLLGGFLGFLAARTIALRKIRRPG